ncbi:MAG: hypothetical protein J6U50_06125 [Lachnospiraceae bacterium]|nr:hypothetical protein [Lachnospiraceae bacterium]
MKTYNRVISRIIAFIMMAAVLIFAPAGSMNVRAAGTFNESFFSSGHTGTEPINDSDRQAAYNYLISYMNNLITVNKPSQDIKDRLEEVWSGANSYIANNNYSASGLVAYVNETVANFDLVMSEQSSVSSTEEFLFINTNSITTTASYGEYTYLTLSIINLGKADVTDVVITPQENTDVNKWPFEITTASNALVIPKICASSDIHTAHTLAQDATWVFLVRKDAKTGTYPLNFDVIYYRNGTPSSTTLTTYININGAPGSGNLIPPEEEKEDEGRTPTPRIIVTGFKTDPEVVYAGDTFNLTITVQNTSLTTGVSNIQFDLKAASTGNNSETTYEAFLPTSGSATKFVSAIPAGATASISIEMTARSDLAQKPYVIVLDAVYEDSKANPYQMSSNISIPVRQEARVDYGEAEILPDSIFVGNSANVMFPVYNKGKTTLYNVQVDFIGDSIEGGSTFLGKLEPGATGNVDAMVNGIAPTMDDGTIIARISYEDESGNVSYLDKEITLYVMEAYYEDSDWTDYPIYDEPIREEKGGIFWKPIIITIVVVIVAAIIIWRVIASKRKKKKMLKELEDLDDDEI